MKHELGTMLAAFPAEELKRAMLHLDRFDTDVVTDERLNAVSAEENLDKVSEKIIEENL
jgi:hypothetical protein